MPQETAALGWRGPMRGVIELALWMLADWDGMATARAAQLPIERPTPVPSASPTSSPATQPVLVTRLSLPIPSSTSSLPPASLWGRKATLADFQQQAHALRDQLSDPEEATASAYVASAIGYRCPRHPAIVTEAAGATGVHVQRVITQFQRLGRRALWPSQAQAVAGGLLDRGHPSLAIKLPTSGGKTLLIELPRGRGPRYPLATVDAVILEAIAEGATVDGELRQDLEALLARTLWYQGAHPALRDFVLTRAAQRAERLRGAVPPGPWASAFYRTGLPVRSCLALRDALVGRATELAEHLQDSAGDHDALLLALATRIAPAARELCAWADLDTAVLHNVLKQWMDGASVDQIAAAHPDAWDVVADRLDSLLPWVLTATVEFLL